MYIIILNIILYLEFVYKIHLKLKSNSNTYIYIGEAVIRQLAILKYITINY